MLGPWKCPFPHLATILLYRLHDITAKVAILLHKARPEVVEEAKHVVADQDLTVATSAGANADRRNRERSRDLLGKLRRHAFDDHGKRAGLLGGQGVFQEFLLVALNAKAAQPVHRL